MPPAIDAAEALSVPETREAGATRRSFIRGVASAGASTAAAAAVLQVSGIVDLIGESEAEAAGGAVGNFATFDAIAASSADAFEVPSGYRADVLLSYGDTFANADGTTYTFGYNNDFIAYFPLNGSSKEGLLFVNHEYPAPFFQHGEKVPANKTQAQILTEQDSVGNSIVHIKQNADGLWQVVSPSFYNRRITGHSTLCEFTGPLKGQNADGSQSGVLIIGNTAHGSIANCSGGITPWGTALSCEENFDGYGSTSSAFAFGWGNANGLAMDPSNVEYDETKYAKYGWVVETDPYDPSYTPRKHTALGRFRHENTAFRSVPGKKFVLYMGDDKADAAVYKFVSDLPFVPGANSNNRKILESGKLYVAWFDASRRVFTNAGDTVPTTPTSGVGYWREVTQAQLDNTNEKIRTAVGDPEWLAHHATNRPEDVEVDTDGTVYISFTNNSGVKDSHGAIRKLVEKDNDPTMVGEPNTFAWTDYAGGGDRGADKPAGERGFSSCDNLCFDSQGNLWVVTDISSASLAGSTSPKPEYAYHLNNAVFMIPRSGPNAGIAFRFANMPIEAEGTGPYFTPDETTLFVDVQHPGEETTAASRNAVYGDPTTYSSYWPKGNKTTGTSPSTPLPSLVAVTKIPVTGGGGGGVVPPPPTETTPTTTTPTTTAPSTTPPPPVTTPPTTGPGSTADAKRPTLRLSGVPARRPQSSAVKSGVPFKVDVDEAVSATFTLTAKLPSTTGGKAKAVTLGRASRDLRAGGSELTLKLSTAAKLRVMRLKGKGVSATLSVVATDAAGNRATARDTVRLV